MRILCFDIGGTSIKYSLVENFEIQDVKSVKTPLSKHYNDIPNLIADIALTFSDYDVISISCAGIIDTTQGTVIFAEDTIPNFIGAEFKKVVEARVLKEVFILNDVNAAVYGEYCIRDNDSILMIAIGTGVGGGYIEDSKLLSGHSGAAMEIGHTSILNNTEQCYCGKYGCFEYKCSTNALLNHYQELSTKEVNGIEFFEQYKNGEANAQIVYQEFIKNLGQGISNFVYIFNPEVVVIGGGISAVGQFFIDDIKESVLANLNSYLAKNLKVEAAKLNNDAALVGMYYYALNKRKKELDEDCIPTTR